MKATQIKGLLLEEVVAYLLRHAGYVPIRRPEVDPSRLRWRANGLNILGRGGEHQVDVLAELYPTPPYSPPMRVVSEAKWQEKPVGIEIVRAGVGITEDLNQGTQTAVASLRHATALPVNYLYRYILFSRSGFSSGAQRFALAHHVTLVDLGSTAFAPLRASVSAVGKRIYEEQRRHGVSSTPGIMNAIRNTVAEGLNTQEAGRWGGYRPPETLESFVDGIVPAVEELRDAARNFEELFIGVTQTGWLILMTVKGKDRRRATDQLKRVIREGKPRVVRLFWIKQSEDRIRWHLDIMEPDSTRREVRLEFALPDQVVRQLVSHGEEIRQAALNIKEQHFASLQLYRTDGRQQFRSVTLSLDHNWLERAREGVRADEEEVP